MALVERVDLLRRCTIFDRVPDRLLVEVAEGATVRTLGPGDRIQTVGQPVEYLDLIVSGEVELLVDDSASLIKEAGEALGELQVLHRRPAPVEVRALTAVELLRVSARTLNHLFEQRPALAAGVMASLAATLDSSTGLVRPPNEAPAAGGAAEVTTARPEPTDDQSSNDQSSNDKAAAHKAPNDKVANRSPEDPEESDGELSAATDHS